MNEEDQDQDFVLIHTLSPKVWAEIFVASDFEITEELMITWFANAMCVASDSQSQKYEKMLAVRVQRFFERSFYGLVEWFRRFQLPSYSRLKIIQESDDDE